MAVKKQTSTDPVEPSKLENSAQAVKEEPTAPKAKKPRSSRAKKTAGSPTAKAPRAKKSPAKAEGPGKITKTAVEQQKTLPKSRSKVVQAPSAAKAAKSPSTARKRATRVASQEAEESFLPSKPRKQSSLDSTLIIVESPTKAKALTKMLGTGYTVKASVGHIVDLPKSRLAIDVEHHFQPEYILVKGKAKVKKELQEAAAKAGRILLASDPDREGEAIAWHLARLLGVDPASECRVRVHEITRDVVTSAVASPGTIDMNRVEAQQARRVLDRLVGYTLSPLLWKKVRRGLSAGRVQSVALAIICQREREIQAFVPQDYWTVTVQASASDGRRYQLRVEKEGGASLLQEGKTLKIDSLEKAQAIEKALCSNPLTVDSFVTREGRRNAPAPFRTSTLQQEAARRLGFSPKRTMAVAQSLFEGVNVPGRGMVGLITYMRTDSLRLAPEAVAQIRQVIGQDWGAKYLPARAVAYQAGANAQDAHEAIRPTDVTLKPQVLKEALSPEQFRLYDLIWRRAVASQMAQAQVDSSTITALGGPYELKAQGTSVAFEGWGALWPLEIKNDLLSPAQPGEVLTLEEVKSEQKQTKPPARYSESTLIKTLEEDGIGRPSTYASIVETLYDRDYVRRDEDRHLTPSHLGQVVDRFLCGYFSEGSPSPIVDVGFTSTMESFLDQVEAGERSWDEVVGSFWKPFTEAIEAAQEAPSMAPPPPEPTGELCPQCGKALIRRRSRFGEFVGCSGFPECTYIQPAQKKIGVPCPKCGADQGGEMIQRKSKKGRTFYSCSRYPDCDFVAWNRPAGINCPSCGAPMEYKGRSTTPQCPSCGHRGEQ